MRRGAAAAMAAIALSCGAPGERPGRAASAIQGGNDDAVDSLAVGVCGGAPGSCALTCSGTLLAPNLVLTARHCVQAATSPVDCATATFGAPLSFSGGYSVTTDPSMHQSTRGWHAVSAIATPSTDVVCGTDLALLILADLVPPSEATPATPNLVPLTEHAVLAPAVAVLGYGLTAAAATEAGAPTSGARRLLEGVPIECLPGDPDPTFSCSAPDLTFVVPNEFLIAGGVCDGDSGSGAFEQTSFDAGARLAVGVASRGGTDPLDATRCVAGVFTRLDPWGGFLKNVALDAASRGGYAPPVWAAPPDAGPAGSVAASGGGCAIAAAPTARMSGGEAALVCLATLALARRRRPRVGVHPASVAKPTEPAAAALEKISQKRRRRHDFASPARGAGLRTEIAASFIEERRCCQTIPPLRRVRGPASTR